MKTTESKWSEPIYLTCEKRWIYFALITVAGFWGAYTYLLRVMYSAMRKPATWCSWALLWAQGNGRRHCIM